jgi:O-antigen/teichoic acid export membrane protein
MIYLDRFLIGAFISAAAVAYYATPYEAVNKLTLIPSALVGVLFPAFAVSFVQDQKRSLELLDRGVRVIFLVLFPLTLVIVVLANEGMSLWLGQTFAEKSTLVLQLLAIGVLMNNLASVPYTFVQGVGRPEIAAKLHLFELPLYLLLLWQLLPIYGIVGAAIAWTLRTTLDMIILYILTFRLIRLDVVLVRRTALMIGIGILVLLIALFPFDLNIKVVLLVLGLIVFSIITWLMLLLPNERVLALSWIKKLQKIS